MIDKKKQIEEMAKDVTGSIVWCSLEDDFLTVDGFRTAEALYERGYRKLEEHEWEEVAIVKLGEIVKRCYECPVCSVLCDTNEPLCPTCGAKMKGGEPDA